MASSLIDIADWIDRFGMELLDADAEALEAPASRSQGSAALSRGGLACRSTGAATLVVELDPAGSERVPELLH
ncbi:hypothetical protein [Piscinibacter koreensis]|uniref:Uncharacterized protein n=1 Tax=Piscinibacter koreensis TaxID=2742824 RepID=A0A7Y6NJA9_9BURK|nr:hypothetical protein [Schlegelella koreensis]NUZ04215.1 hypothetical protein [Schlegelella koreensis]